MAHRSALIVLMLCGFSESTGAQTYTAAGDLLFYGDNTEFANPFREGETLLGASGRITLDVALNKIVTLRGGIFGLGRFGAHTFLEQGEPVLALAIGDASSRFIFGSLETAATRTAVAGPDVETLHGLLPPLQREQLTFSRGQEMGLQWLVDRPRLNHDLWINWQRLNTDQHRERFDTGYRGAITVARALALHGQWHLVHEGGQQFDSGAVSDSQAAALGIEWTGAAGAGQVSLESHVVATRHVPDRAQPLLTDAGLGSFTRVAWTRSRWRAHGVVWRSRDTLKAEGDPNYLSARRDGTMFRRVRDYGELGLTRHFSPAPGLHMFAAARLHRVESHYEYSYRIVARVRWLRPL